MTKDGSFKKVVRRHAQENGQLYTEALTDLEGVEGRLAWRRWTDDGRSDALHEPIARRLLVHLRDHYGVDAVAATKVSHHNDHVFRVERGDGDPWVARVFPPARPRAGAEGDAAILRFLERQHYPAERLAVDEAASVFDGLSVLVTQFVTGGQLRTARGPTDTERFIIMGDLLGRLHALPLDESVSRPGGASGEDPTREGSPRQDVLAALSFLDVAEAKVAATGRKAFEPLRTRVRSADDGHGLPQALVHGNLLHAHDHVIVSERGPVAIQWKASGRGPRLADFAYLMWGTRNNAAWIDAAVRAYCQHVELTDDELERLEGVMYVRPMYLACFGYGSGRQPGRGEDWWEHISATAAAVRDACRR
ncbi:aminoglycoside phosphotransferase family protein [Actinopolymorpha sp. B9G3]|uniref:phosphotransferase enzyme family protein n=1 Tax=Actinopolymorpha sp. B9G3 TaxID=3158970 RepID=UPI0032D998E6